MAVAVGGWGEEEMKEGLTRAAPVASALSPAEISNGDVGQTSGQGGKPKKISVGRPCRLLSVTTWPAWSVNWKGPPIAAGAATCRKPPSAHSISTSPTTRLPAKAATMTSGRVVRSIIRSVMKFPVAGSEAGGDARRDHLEKDRRAVMEPERQRTEQNGGAESYSARPNRRRDPPRAQHGGRLLCRNRLGHGQPSETTGFERALPPTRPQDSDRASPAAGPAAPHRGRPRP